MADEKEQSIGFRVSPAERAAIAEAAHKNGMNISDYIKAKVFTAGDGQLERLARYQLYMLDRIQMALYAIANEGHIVPQQRLQQFYAEAVVAGVRHFKDLDQRMAKMEKELTEYLATIAGNGAA